MVNRLVCAAFHGAPPSPEHEAAHDDGVRTNNVPDNLSWKTSKQNHADRVRHGTHNRGTRSATHVLTDDDVLFIRANYIWASRGPNGSTALGKKYGVSHVAIHRAVTGKTWQHLQPISA
jgi:hypothetical protein